MTIRGKDGQRVEVNCIVRPGEGRCDVHGVFCKPGRDAFVEKLKAKRGDSDG
jgi:hypothetical protein